MSKAQVNPDASTIRAFLENVLDRDWFHLLKSNPKSDGFTTFSGYVTDSVDDAVDWLMVNSEKKRNLYYSVNFPPRTRSKKARKEDLQWLDFLHTDIDLPKTMRRDDPDADDYILDKLDEVKHSKLIPGKPHLILSGNGVQALWPLAEPLKATPDNIEKVELINRRLAEAFGGDSCHNAERILRVPGLPNYPDQLKRSRGYGVVLAKLAHITRDTFALEDFDRLPKVKAAEVRRSANRTDYTTLDYSDGYKPYTFQDFFETRADIAELMEEKLEDTGEDDRSPVCASFISHMIEFFMNMEDCAAHDLLDDVDVHKNMVDIFLEGAEQLSVLEYLLSRYEENSNRFGLGNLGYDIQHMLASAADDKRRATGASQKRAKDRRKSAELAKVPLAEITPLEARIETIGHIRGAISNMDQLPNWREKANSQLVTEANLRMILQEAGVVARWDAMRDEARYSISPDAGKVDERERPSQYWDRALANAHADTRASAEESLLCDALAQFSMTARREIPELLKMIAKENRFHPIEDYCKARAWDGRPRIAELAACIDTDHPLVEVYLRQHFRCCIAAVKSLRQYLKTGDGLQIDTAVILDGAQGLGKSTFWNMVTPDGFMSKGTSLRLGSHGENDSKRECLSALVCCLNEIGTTYQRSIADALKDFRASRSDEFRLAFGRVPISKPRMTAFCGTANSLQLHDHTGSRRDLVVRVFGFDFARMEDILADGGLQQIFAEAWQEVMLDGRNWWLTKDQEKVRAEYNEGYRAISEEEEKIGDYLARIGDMHTRQWLTATAICSLLNIRYSPTLGPKIRRALEDGGCDYKEQVRRRNGTKLRRVFSFPILPENYKLLTEK